MKLFDDPLSVEDANDLFFREPYLVGRDGDALSSESVRICSPGSVPPP